MGLYWSSLSRKYTHRASSLLFICTLVDVYGGQVSRLCNVNGHKLMDEKQGTGHGPESVDARYFQVLFAEEAVSDEPRLSLVFVFFDASTF
jgi:hypothetical protein